MFTFFKVDRLLHDLVRHFASVSLTHVQRARNEHTEQKRCNGNKEGETEEEGGPRVREVNGGSAGGADEYSV